jgi:lipopolysaccharide/colanic/teichoic acid biosynthesis glycosyltransferase/capsular polysaccharide biosynthesis protein
VKHCVDRLIGFVLVGTVLPILALIAVAVAIEGRGPVLVREPRVGSGGREFGLLAFRADGPRVGPFLRRHALDRVPQLFHVLAGTMAIVGPRPPRPDELAAAGFDGPGHLLSVKPGLTGLRAADDEFARLARRYAENWSPALELQILRRALAAVPKGSRRVRRTGEPMEFARRLMVRLPPATTSLQPRPSTWRAQVRSVSASQQRQPMSPLRKYTLRVANRWVLVAVLAIAGGVLAALWSLATVTTTWTATAALTSQSQERSPDQDGVLALGYVDYFNQDSYQQLLRAQANIPDEVSLSAQTGASSPILYIQASGPSEELVRDAAAAAAEVFREDVRESLVTERRQAVDDLQAEIDRQVQDLNSLERTDVEKNVILDQIRSLQGRLTEFLADNTNHLKQLQPQPGVSSSTPSPMVDILSGLAGGAILGVLLALLMAVLDRRVHSAADAEDVAGLPVLADLGRRLAGRRTRLQNLLNGLSASEDGATPVVALAGVRRSDGAAVLAHELVAAWASRRGGALHVMADLRAPLAGYEQVPGFVDVLQGRAGVPTTAIPLPDGVRVLPPGAVADIDPYAVAEPRHLRWAFQEAATTAGLVVVEAPPVLDAPESQSICAAADRVVLVVDGRTTRADELGEAATLLRAVGAHVVGIVIDRSGGRLATGPALPRPGEVRPAPALVAAGHIGNGNGNGNGSLHGSVNGNLNGHGDHDWTDAIGVVGDDDAQEPDDPDDADGTAEGGHARPGYAEPENPEPEYAEHEHVEHDGAEDHEDGDAGEQRPSPFPRSALAGVPVREPAESGDSVGTRDGQWQG